MEFRDQTYLALPLAAFRTDDTLQCDVFIHLPTNGRMVRLALSGQTLDPARLAAYAEHGLKELFVLDPLKHPGSYEFRGESFNPEIPEEYRPGAVVVNIRESAAAEGASAEATDAPAVDSTTEADLTAQAGGATDTGERKQASAPTDDEPGSVEPGEEEETEGGSVLSAEATEESFGSVESVEGAVTVTGSGQKLEPKEKTVRGKAAAKKQKPESVGVSGGTEEEEEETRLGASKEAELAETVLKSGPPEEVGSRRIRATPKEAETELRFGADGEEETGERRFGADKAAEEGSVRIRGLTEKKDTFEKRFSADKTPPADDAVRVIQGKSQPNAGGDLQVRSLGGTAGKAVTGAGAGTNLGKTVGSAGEGEKTEADQMIGRTKKKRPSLAENKAGQSTKLTEPDAAPLASSQIRPSPAPDETVRRAVSESQAFEQQNEAGQRLKKLLAKMDEKQLAEETQAERFATERLAFLDRELSEHLRYGAELDGLVKLNPASVTPETMEKFFAQARFLATKFLLAAKVGEKIKVARAAYGSRDSATRARIREATKPFEEALLKIAVLADPRAHLPAGFSVPATPAWGTATAETPELRLALVLQGLKETVAQSRKEELSFSDNQKIYREALEIESAEAEAAEIGRHLGAGSRGLHYCGLAVTLAQGMGYNRRDFLEDVALFTLLRFDEKVRAFPKLPERLRAPLAKLSERGTNLPMALRDLRDILDLVEAFANAKREFNFGTAGNELAEGFPATAPAVDPDNAAQGIGFLRLKASGRAAALSRNSALRAGRSAISWI